MAISYKNMYKYVVVIIISALLLNIAVGSYIHVGKPWVSIMNDDIKSQLEGLNQSKSIIAMWDKEPIIYSMTNTSLSYNRYDFNGQFQTILNGFSAEHDYDRYFMEITHNNSYYVIIFPNDYKIMEELQDSGKLSRNNITYNSKSFMAIKSAKYAEGYRGLIIYES